MNTFKKTFIRAALLAVASSVLLVGACVYAVESHLGPVNVSSYSLSGPRTWTAFSGRAKVIASCGDYKLWQRNDPKLSISG